jgi:hypothetical protein
MRVYILGIVLFGRLFSYSVSNTDILEINFPSLPIFLSELQKVQGGDVLSDVVSVFSPSVGISPRVSVPSFVADATPNIYFHIGFDLTRLVKNPVERKKSISSEKEKIIRVYGDLCKSVISGRTLCKRLDTMEELRTNTSDFEKRMNYADTIFQLEKSLLDLYERTVSLELDLYSTVGIRLDFSDAIFCYEINYLKYIFNSTAGRQSSSFVSTDRGPRYR